MNPFALGAALAGAAAVGAVLRFLAGRALNDEFPYGTLLVNLVASFALGLIASLDDPIPVVVGIGGLGALSTWSTAANEAAVMARNDEAAVGVGYLSLSVSVGILMAWIGLRSGAVLF